MTALIDEILAIRACRWRAPGAPSAAAPAAKRLGERGAGEPPKK
ncbi:MAG: hypothetical protein U0359_06140 [Byssovorax sp.]